MSNDSETSKQDRDSHPTNSGLMHRAADDRRPTADGFNLEATVRLLQRRPTNRTDRWQDGCYYRAFPTAEGVRLVRVTNVGTTAVPDVRVEILGERVAAESAAALEATVNRMLGLDEPAAPIAWLTEIEPRLASVATALRGFRPPCFPTLFETCAAVLPFQQLSLDAGTAIVGRLVERFGSSLTLLDQRWFAFPPPEAIAGASPQGAARDRTQPREGCGAPDHRPVRPRRDVGRRAPSPVSAPGAPA